jgi:uncharacterized protein (TIGR02058 family)
VGTDNRPAWTQEWKEKGLGCSLVDTENDSNNFISNLFFVQMGFGVDQHGDSNNATKAAIRAVRNAIEFNSIPGVIEAIPGGRKEMLIQVKLGIPPDGNDSNDTSTSTVQQPMRVDPLEVAKVFPYGRLLPIEMVVGGLSFSTGRLVPELGDSDDMAVCVAACVSIGYNDGNSNSKKAATDGDEDDESSVSSVSSSHTVYSTKDGF